MVVPYFLDTNVLLRYCLHDIESQELEFLKWIERAKNKEVTLVLSSCVVFEIEFVLRKVYKLPRIELSSFMQSILKIDVIDTEDVQIWRKVFEIYPKTTIDLTDIFLYVSAKQVSGEVLTFDKDFEKLKKLF